MTGRFALYRNVLRAVLFVVLLASGAGQAQARTFPGQVIDSVTVVDYVGAQTGHVYRTSVTHSFVVEERPSPSSIEILRHAPAWGAPVVVRQGAYRSGGDGGPLMPQAPPNGLDGAPLTLAQPVPLIAASAFNGNDTIFVRLTDIGRNFDPASIDTVEIAMAVGGSLDEERFVLSETELSSGVFVGYARQAAGSSFDGSLTTAANEPVQITYVDPYAVNDVASISVLVDPFGIVFDSLTGAPIDGVRVSIVEDASGAPATVYGDDGVSLYPSTVISGDEAFDSSGSRYDFAAGGYRFPLLAPGDYRLVVVPPPGARFPSAASDGSLQALPGAPFALGPGARGQAFTVAAGPAVRIDLPVDVPGDLFLNKTAGKDLVAAGDFVPYRLTLRTGTDVVAPFRIEDALPIGFRYVAGSARRDGRAVADPAVGDDGRTLSFATPGLGLSAETVIDYVVEVGAATPLGRAINRARAFDARDFASNPASAALRVRDDFFRDAGFVVGRVRIGRCDADPGRGTIGAAGVRIQTQDGTVVTTDATGRYHLEGLAPGIHVLRLDPASLPPGTVPGSCRSNTRQIADGGAQFVDLPPGMVQRADFLLMRTEEPAIPSSTGSAGDGRAEPVDDDPPGFAEAEPVAEDWRDPGLAPFRIVEPLIDHRPRTPSVHFAVAHAAGQSVALRLGGEPVPERNRGHVERSADGTRILQRWRGIDLQEGENRFEVLLLDARGAVVDRLERIVRMPGEPVEAHVLEAASQPVADGRAAPRIALRLTDARGIAARAGGLVRYSVQAPHESAARAAAIARSPLEASLRPQQAVIGEDGVIVVELAPTLRSGVVRIDLDLAGRRRTVEAWLEQPARDWFMVGFAEGTLGHGVVGGNMDTARALDAEDGFYEEGRVAFFAKGSIKGEWLLTVAYDSARERDDTDRLFQAIDPDAYYPVYGDASRTEHEAPTSGPLYVRLERRQFFALIGDFTTDLEATRLARYDRPLHGLQSAYRGEQVAYTAFLSDTRQRFVRNEIPGDGTSGLYRLTRAPIVINSEQIVLETRDRVRAGVVLEERRLVRHLDYEIDYDDGTLFFKEPVPSRDFGFDPVVIVATYETDGGGDRAATFGGRGEIALGDGLVTLGASFVQEGDDAEGGRLFGADAEVALAPGTTLRGEIAHARRDRPLEGEAGGPAYLVELEHQGADAAGRLYAERRDAQFGLGQENDGLAGTFEVGAEASVQVPIGDDGRLAMEIYRREREMSDARRDAAEVTLDVRNGRTRWQVGGRHVVESRDSGDAAGESETVDQLLLGSRHELLDGRLGVFARREQNLKKVDAESAFPTRTIVGLDYALGTTPVLSEAKLTVAHELAETEDGTEQRSRLGVTGGLWQGAQLRASGEHRRVEDGERVLATVGLAQTWQVDEALSLSAGVDRQQSIAGDDDLAGLGRTGPTEDFTALSLGAGASLDAWGLEGWGDLTTRAESRFADSGRKYIFSIGHRADVAEHVQASQRLRLIDETREDDEDRTYVELRSGLAYRPEDGPVLLDRLDVAYGDDRRGGTGSGGSGSTGGSSGGATDGLRIGRRFKIVNNATAVVTPVEGVEVALHQGLKFVAERIGDKRYTSSSALFGGDLRFDLTDRLDLGVRASLVTGLDHDQLVYAFGPTLGFKFGERAWLGLGYNFQGYEDRDFADAGYAAQGPYLRFRLALDEDLLEGVMNDGP
ncbi:MAG: carboxypeptidase regulatory-like domain-containing protein [Geminicoccaceae bacterium]|nr:carboxypeptidase regulatory-like domain-containing protein [Geminicoccaceae bacterium]